MKCCCDCNSDLLHVSSTLNAFDAEEQQRHHHHHHRNHNGNGHLIGNGYDNPVLDESDVHNGLGNDYMSMPFDSEYKLNTNNATLTHCCHDGR